MYQCTVNVLLSSLHNMARGSVPRDLKRQVRGYWAGEPYCITPPMHVSIPAHGLKYRNKQLPSILAEHWGWRFTMLQATACCVKERTLRVWHFDGI